ncbi:trypsin-like peptidase domain-containing protein [Bradyrhizobium sp. CCGE-LA001]|uniref:trypsin-like peptidase domain-containing protein n=1 Tax=Bradyrhizobium sp. CCGE-LA001 TaxID=1223566 RepID=UPI001198273F
MADVPSIRLDGETDPNAWHFSRLGEEGPLPNPVGHTFPLVTHDADGKWRVVGTGFYINDGGFFVTAAHVIEEVLEENRQRAPLLVLHLHSPTGVFGASEFHARPIAQCWVSDSADVALGVAASSTHKVTGEVMKNWTWTLSWGKPAERTLVHTYAFPNHIVVDDGRRIRFAPHAYSGRVLSFGEFRDRVMLPFPYIEVDFRIHGAASGGPIISGSYVVGINCTELQANLDHPSGPAFGVQSHCLADAFLDNVVLPLESSPRRVTFNELVCSGVVNVHGYSAPNETASQKGHLVDLTMAATVPLPRIELQQYF